jgi:hypothetical protein
VDAFQWARLGRFELRALDQPIDNLILRAADVMRLAALLGAALAFRPRRRGTPPRVPADAAGAGK